MYVCLYFQVESEEEAAQLYPEYLLRPLQYQCIRLVRYHCAVLVYVVQFVVCS